MKLNHINLPVEDVGVTRDFFAKYFGMEAVVERGKNTLAILRDEGEMVLILSHFSKSGEVHYHKDFHVGFYLGSREEVDGVNARMVADGLDVDPAAPMQGRYTFYVRAPGDFEVEVASLEGAHGALDRKLETH